MKCIFIEAWTGQCKKEICENSQYCEEHQNKKCVSCGAQATHSCDETGQFICGAFLCDKCEHTIAKDGTNGMAQFSPYPPGYKDHCKKSEQIYIPWYERENF